MRGSQRMKIIKICLLALLILTIAGSAAYMVLNKDKGGKAPSITGTKDKISVPCEYSDSDLLKGLTASDAEDGDLTDGIIIGNFSKFKTRGTADLEYVVFDSDGNFDSYKREVQFSDYEPPKITFNKPYVFYANKSTSGVLRQYTEANDLLDGDITKHLKITDTDADFDKIGDYKVAISVKNSFGDEVTMEFPVHVLDAADDKGNTIALKAYIVYLDKGAGFDPNEYFIDVVANYSGTAVPPDTYSMNIDSDVDMSKNGIYEVHYTAVSSEGSALAETWLTVVVGEYGG